MTNKTKRVHDRITSANLATLASEVLRNEERMILTRLAKSVAGSALSQRVPPIKPAKPSRG